MERFWSKVDKNGPDGCWLWTAYINPVGYGQIQINGRAVSAHRYSYELHKGPTPSGFHIDHKCEVRRCVNPEHLEAVTPEENIAHRWFGGKRYKYDNPSQYIIRSPRKNGLDPQLRFWPKVNKDSKTGCWYWQGLINKGGYGRIKVNGKKVAAHRFAYEALIGPIPAGKQLDHLCHTWDKTCTVSPCKHRSCVNPAHLEPVTRVENTLRGNTISARNAAKTHCPKGHAYSEHGKLALSGSRYCYACITDYRNRPDVKQRNQAYFRARWRSDEYKAARRKTACKHGHPIDKELIRRDGRIMRYCSICQASKVTAMRRARLAATKT